MNFERKKNRSQNQFFIDFSMRLKEKKLEKNRQRKLGWTDAFTS